MLWRLAQPQIAFLLILNINAARTPARPIEMSVYGNEIIEQEVEK